MGVEKAPFPPAAAVVAGRLPTCLVRQPGWTLIAPGKRLDVAGTGKHSPLPIRVANDDVLFVGEG